jgi:predicted O-linked N-acetylglucosamine transferase (SPINDLY family)
MGFTELIANDAEDYARKAVRVANDRAFREHCRARISESCGVLFEDVRFVRHCEDALSRMVRGA